jgi:hypothetical protein
MKKGPALVIVTLVALVATAASAVAGAAAKQRGPFAGAVHVEFAGILRDGSTTTVAYDRGAKPDHALRGIVHADVTVTTKKGAQRQFQYDRGKITAIGSGSVTVRRADKQSVTLSLDSSTLVREKGQRESVDELEIGERAMFFSKGGATLLVRCVSKPK